MTEEKTLTAAEIEQIEKGIKDMVDTFRSGTASEVADKLKSQFVDRSTQYLSLPSSPKNPDVEEAYLYVNRMLKNISMETRKKLRLSFPESCYSKNDPITILYESNQKLVSLLVTVLMGTDEILEVLFLAMFKAGIDFQNIDSFLNQEQEILAHLQNMPQIAAITKGMPDYSDFNTKRPGNYRYMDAKKKIEHTVNGKLVSKVSLETGGPPDEDGEPTPLEIEDPNNVIKEVAAKMTVEQCFALCTPKEKEILELNLKGKTLSYIAEKVGYHDASGVSKAIKRIGKKLIDAGIVSEEEVRRIKAM